MSEVRAVGKGQTAGGNRAGNAGTPGLKDYVLLTLLAAMWGSSFMFIKIAVAEIPPLTIATGRIGLAAVILYIVMRMAGHRLPRDIRSWVMMAGIAFFGNALPFTLIGWGEQTVDSGLAAILMAIMPLATLMLAHFLTEDERMSWPKIAGLACGFAGIVVLIGPAVLQKLGGELIGQAAVAGGAICYAISSIIAKKLTGEHSGRTTAAGVMILATLMLIPFCLVGDRPWTLSPGWLQVASVAYLGTFSTALAMILLLTIVRTQGATFLSMNNYMVPLFGVLWGVLFLAETPDPNAFAALALILGGIAISRRKRLFGKALPDRTG